MEDILSGFEENAGEDEPVEEGTDAEGASESEQEEVIDSAGDTAKGDTMETNKKTTPILPPDIQRMIDEIEGIIPPEEEKKEPTGVYLKRKEEPSENMGQVAEDLRIDDDLMMTLTKISTRSSRKIWMTITLKKTTMRKQTK